MNDTPSPWDAAPATPCGWFNMDDQARRFRAFGVATVPLLAPDTAYDMADRIGASAHRFKRVEYTAHGVNGSAPEGRAVRSGSAAYGRRASYTADAETAYAACPELRPLVDVVRLIAEGICGRPVITSPYPASECTVKLYRAGDEQGPHRDSNPLTGLLVLAGRLPTLIDAPNLWDDQERCAGTLAIFQGRRLWHSVAPLPVGETKVVAVFNLYHPDDQWRPASLDSLVYGDRVLTKIKLDSVTLTPDQGAPGRVVSVRPI